MLHVTSGGPGLAEGAGSKAILVQGHWHHTQMLEILARCLLCPVSIPALLLRVKHKLPGWPHGAAQAITARVRAGILQNEAH